jgi:hypothetical protein
MVLADWVLLKHGFDPAARWRGSYDDEAGAQRVVENEGGTLALLDKALLPHGISRTRSPISGNICIVKAPTQRTDGGSVTRATGALCLSSNLRAVMSVDIGLVIAELPLVAAWSV